MDILFTIDLTKGFTGDEQLGRVTRIYASAHVRDSVHRANIHEGEERQVVAECHGLLSLDDAIESVLIDNRGSATVGTVSLASRSFGFPLSGVCGTERLRMVITTTNGAKYVEWLVVEAWR